MKQPKHSGRKPGGSLGRRNFLKLGGLFGIAAVGAPELASRPARAKQQSYPSIDVAPLADIVPGTEVFFAYPDEDSPAVLLRLDGPAEGGIGPNESIVAFSMLCTHKGCPVQFRRDKAMLICPCHWSSFDAAKAGRMIIGQAVAPLPQITLRIQGGQVQATGLNGLIYGRHTNIL